MTDKLLPLRPSFYELITLVGPRKLAKRAMSTLFFKEGQLEVKPANKLDHQLVAAISESADISVVRNLIELGADIECEIVDAFRIRKVASFTNVLSNYIRTPLSTAILQGNGPVVDLLLSYGADPWRPGNGERGYYRSSAMDITSSWADVDPIRHIVLRHSDHVISCREREVSARLLVERKFNMPPLDWDLLGGDGLTTKTSLRPEASYMIEELKHRQASSVEQAALERSTAQVQTPSRPPQRL